MVNRYRNPFALCSAIAVLICAGAAQSQGPTPSPVKSECNPPKSYTQSPNSLTNIKQRGTETFPFFAHVVTETNEKEANEHTAEENRDASLQGRIILLTGVLAASTIGLGWYTARLAHFTAKAVKDGAEALKIARMDFAATHRPRLRIRNIVINYQVRESYASPLKGHFYITNVGQTVASIVESHCEVHWNLNGLPMRRPYEGKAGNGTPAHKLVGPGMSVQHLFSSGGKFPGWNETKSLYVMGWVEYVDHYKGRYRTAFCRMLEQRDGGERFYPVNDSDYEHEE